MADIKYLDKAGLGTVKSILEGLFAPKSHSHGYWTWNENTIKGVKVNNASYADTAGSANKIGENSFLNTFNKLYYTSKSVTMTTTNTDWYVKITLSAYAQPNQLFVYCSYNNEIDRATIDFSGMSYGYIFKNNCQNSGNIKGVCFKSSYDATEKKWIFWLKFDPIYTDYYSPSSSATCTVYLSDQNDSFDISATTTDPGVSWITTGGDNNNIIIKNATLYGSLSGNASTATYATTAGSAPASDVYSWAKAAEKPTYNFGEIGAGIATIGDGANRLMFRTNVSYRSGIYYSTPGNEALVFGNKNSVTSWIFATTDPNTQTAWNSLTPSLQIKNGRVTINKLILEATDAAYNLDVNGSANATTLYENGIRVSTSGHTHTKSQITDFPTSLPANGGNADTVGGKSSADFAPASHSHIFWNLSDATIKMYQAANDHQCGLETFCLQTCFDAKDGETHNYVNDYSSRCILNLQARGGRVGIGKMTPGYTLDVNGSANATTLYENGTRVALVGHGHGYWTWDENTIKGVKVNNAGYADSSGNSTTSGDGTMTIVPQYNNEINFGGTNASSTLYIGYRASGSKPIPEGFVFGGSDGSASITASGFKKKSSSDSYVLLGGGGHKAVSDFVTLTTTQTISGTKTFSAQQSFTKSGASPFTVSSNVKVDNLNADFVDGYHASSLFKRLGWNSNTTYSDANTTSIPIGLIINQQGNYTDIIKNHPTSYGYLLNFSTGDEDTYSGVQLYTNYNSDRTFIRSKWSSNWYDWSTLAYMSDIPSSLPADGGNADTIGGKGVSDFARFYLSPMDSGATASSAKSWFTDTMPSGSGAIVYNVPGAEKTIIAGKSSGSYGHMLQLNYDDTYLRILRYKASSWQSTDWEKISAGYADSAGNAATVGGKSASDFATSSHSHSNYMENYISVNNKNMNTIKTPGVYYGYNMSNAGVTDISNFIILNYSNDWGTQLQFSAGSSRAFCRFWQNSGGVMQSTWKEFSFAGHGTHISSGAQTWAGVKTFSSAPVFSAGFSSSANVTITGSVTASQGFFDTSDERLKDFYDDIDVDFDKLKAIPKKYFSWKSDENKEIHLGTSAQEIQKVYPEIVNESADGELSIDYSKLSVVALAAVDKLYDKINKIEQALIDKGIL